METRPFTQFSIIRLIQSSGYAIDDKGICFALTLLWFQACLVGEEEKFIARLRFLNDLSDDFKKKLALFKKDAKYLNDANLSVEEKKQLIDITAFFNSVVVYHQPHKLTHLLGEKLTQKDVDKSSQLASSIGLEKLGNLTNIYSESKPYNKEELTNYFNELKILFTNYTGDGNKLMLTLSSYNHTIGVSFDPDRNLWRIMDAEHLPPYDVDPKEIVNQIFSAFPTWNFQQKKNIFLNASVYSPGQNPKLAAAISDFSQFKNNHDLSFERAHRIDEETGLNLTHIAAQNGDVELISKLADEGINLNARAGSKEYTPAMYAVQNGDVAMLKTLGEKGANFNVKSNGWPLICIAASLGQTEMIDILAQYKANINERIPEGHTAAYLAVSSGNKTAIKALMNAGAIFNQDEVNPIRLLIERKSFDLAVYILLSKKNIGEFDKKTWELLNAHRPELTNSVINLMKKESNIENKKNILLNIVRGKNPIGTILNTPTDPGLFSLRFNPRKFENREITNSIAKILDAFPEVLNTLETNPQEHPSQFKQKN